MSIESVEANAWRNLNIARDAIDIERARRVKSLAPGESISFVDAPMRRPQSIVGFTDTAQSPTDTTTNRVTTADTSVGNTPTGILELSGSGSTGGGAAALLADANVSNDPEDGDRSGEGSIYGSGTRWWEAEWDARMSSYNDQLGPLNTFRGSVSQGYLDYAVEMSLAYLQPPSWDDFVVEMDLEGESALSDPGTADTSTTSTDGDSNVEIITADTGAESRESEDATSSAGGDTSDDSSTANETGDVTDKSVDGTVGDSPLRVVVTGTPIRDGEGNHLEIDAHGNGYVILKGGGTVVVGGLDPALVSQLKAEPQYAGSLLELATQLAAQAPAAVCLAGAGLVLPRAISLADALSWQAVRNIVLGIPGQAAAIALLAVAPPNGLNADPVLSAIPSERFIQRPGESYGRVEKMEADGTWVLDQTVAEYMPAGVDRRYVRLENERYGEFQIRDPEKNDWVSELESGQRNVRTFLIDGRFEILTDEEFRRRSEPLINVTVSPGPAGTPGLVPGDVDAFTPGYPSPNSQAAWTTTLPATPQSWQDLIVDASAPKWVLVNGVPFRTDLGAHLAGPDGYKSGKIFGTHNLENAISLLQISNYWLTPTGIPGIFELNYDYLDSSTGTRATASPKTVYDPAVISDQTILDAATRAGNQAWSIYTSTTGTKPLSYVVIESGIKFQVYINTDQGNAYVGNVHPIK
jgi:hypothetical protein